MSATNEFVHPRVARTGRFALAPLAAAWGVRRFATASRRGRAARLLPPALAVCMLLVAGHAMPAADDATQWKVVPEKSEIEFGYQSNGRSEKGEFARFAGAGVFNPEAPDTAKLEVRIQTKSIDLADAKASAFATSAEWFDSANYPEAVYRLISLSPIDGNRYRAEGELTIRGRTRPVTSTITLDLGEQEAHASGTLSVDRTDYMLGVGPMSLFVDIGREVTVSFDLAARPTK